MGEGLEKGGLVRKQGDLLLDDPTHLGEGHFGEEYLGDHGLDGGMYSFNLFNEFLIHLLI